MTSCRVTVPPHPCRYLLVAAALGLAGCLAIAAGKERLPRAAVDEVSWQHVRADMIALSTDDMAGRGVGTGGYDRAAVFVAKRFSGLGLKSPGDGSRRYYQDVPFVQSKLESVALRVVTARETIDLAHPDDFTAQGGFGSPRESVTAPLAFVGFGISAPELGHDDYAQIDARGRIVIVLTGAPPRFGISERAYYSSLRDKRALAEARGAAAMLIVQTPVDRQRNPWPRLVRELHLPDLRWRDIDGTVNDGFPALPTAVLG